MGSAKGYAKFISATVGTTLLCACVNSGDGGGTNYTGPTTPAAITSNNGEEIIRSAYANGENGAAIGNAFASVTGQTSTTPRETPPRILTTVHLLQGVINRIDPVAASHPALSRAIYPDTRTLTGSCGGTAQYNISIDDVTYQFTGTFTFTNYCEAMGTTNGVMTISGTIDPDTQVFGNVTIILSALGISLGSDSFTIDGSLFAAPGGTNTSPDEVTANVRMRDGATGRVFRTENMIIGITDEVSSQRINIRGRFYHPDHGYVNLITPTPFYIANTDSWPSAGTLIATGADGSKVKLTAVSNTTYSVGIDADGDAPYDGSDTLYETLLSGYWQTPLP